MQETTKKSAVSTREVYKTTDYTELKTLAGNRKLNIGHVNELKRSIEEHGNLTEMFPVKVNIKKEIVDGQHRFEALKELGLPVFYEIAGDLDINDTILLNSSNRNWNWRDFMNSHADRGNENYQRFALLANEFKLGFNTLISYAKNERLGVTQAFNIGNLQFSQPAYEAAKERLQRFIALTIIAQEGSHEFAMGVLEFMKRKGDKYDQAQMESRLERFGPKALYGVYFARDYYDILMEIYHRP